MMGEHVLRLDLGCGSNKQAGFLGVDALPFEGVDLVCDLSKPRWVVPPEKMVSGMIVTFDGAEFADGSVDEVHCSHFLEHLTGEQRVGFFNELYRVLRVGGTARIITPHWSHMRAYGDPTHQWPPVCEFAYYYLMQEWRKTNAPHTGFNCDFNVTMMTVHDPNDPFVAFRNMETKAVMMGRNINTTTDLIANLTKLPVVTS